MTTVLAPLPPTFTATRDALHRLACFAIAPARKAADGHISLQPVDGGIGTPPLPDGAVIRVRGDRLLRTPGPAVDLPITTVRAACEALGVEPSPDPGVGTDLPSYAPDELLAVDVDASSALGAWYALVDAILAAVRAELPPTMTEPKLWPEHFDLAADWGTDDEHRINLGGSPGDSFSDEPYVYAGPWDHGLIAKDPQHWNAPFGAVLRHHELAASDDPAGRACELLVESARRIG